MLGHAGRGVGVGHLPQQAPLVVFVKRGFRGRVLGLLGVQRSGQLFIGVIRVRRLPANGVFHVGQVVEDVVIEFRGLPHGPGGVGLALHLGDIPDGIVGVLGDKAPRIGHLGQTAQVVIIVIGHMVLGIGHGVRGAVGVVGEMRHGMDPARVPDDVLQIPGGRKIGVLGDVPVGVGLLGDLAVGVRFVYPFSSLAVQDSYEVFFSSCFQIHLLLV